MTYLPRHFIHVPHRKQFCSLKFYVFGSCPDNSLLFPTPQPLSDQLVIVKDHKHVKYERTFADARDTPYLFHHTSIKIGYGFYFTLPIPCMYKRNAMSEENAVGSYDRI
jgi:hypothetical protein